MSNLTLASEALPPLRFQKKHALASGASIINAGVVALFKQYPALGKFARVFLEITPENRAESEPVLLKRLIHKIYFEEADLKFKETALQKLRQLEYSWQCYKNYIDNEWSIDQSQANIKLTKYANKDLASMLINRGCGQDLEHLFACSQEALHLLGRDELYSEYEQQGKRFFHSLVPINYITNEQFDNLKRKYSYLKNLSKQEKRLLLGRSPACFNKTYSLANLWQEKRGEIDENDNKIVHTQTIHHASFWARDIDEKARQTVTKANVMQWLTLVVKQYLETYPEVLDQYDFARPDSTPLHVPVATCSLLSGLNPLANLLDKSKQHRQIREIEAIINQINNKPLSLKVKLADSTQLICCRFHINFQAFGTNLVRTLVSSNINELNNRNFAATNERTRAKEYGLVFISFCDRVNQVLQIRERDIKKILKQPEQKFKLHLAKLTGEPKIQPPQQSGAYGDLLNAMLNKFADKPKQRELYYLYLNIRWLYKNYAATAEQNFHLQALFACINDQLQIPYSIWCNESRDRTTRTKIKHEAYLQHKAIYGYFPCWLDETHMQQVANLEPTIHQFSAYEKLVTVNSPGVVGPRIYQKNKPIYKWMLNKLTRYKGNLDDGNAHLRHIEDSMQTSKDLSKSWKEKSLSVKNFFLHPVTFWKAVWYKLTDNPTPYLSTVKLAPDNLMTKQKESQLSYEVDLSNTLPEFKKLLGYADGEVKAVLSYATVTKLHELKLITGLTNGKFIIMESSEQRILKRYKLKEKLINLYDRFQHNNIQDNDSFIIKRLLTSPPLQKTCAKLFALDEKHQREELFNGLIQCCKLSFSQSSFNSKACLSSNFNFTVETENHHKLVPG